MNFKKIVMITATILSVSAAHAETKQKEATDDNDDKNTNTAHFALGLGAGQIDIDNVKFNDVSFEKGTGLSASLSYVYPIKKTPIYAEAKINYISTEDTVASEKCSTTISGRFPVSCDVVAATNVFNIPLTANYRLPVSDSIGLHIGAGGALSYVSRSIELQATGFENAEVQSKKGFNVSPVAQVGISYNRFKLLAENYFTIGEKNVGEGSALSVQLQYAMD